ncbi:MAG: glycosyltransferase family 39 protein [Anaerolineales bacterium]|nr:glycosyltransferase family 39 protein [Anaerolineales bacterium]
MQKLKSFSFLTQHKTAWLFALILAVGMFARLWQLRSLPPGLNVDEASIGVEAYDLHTFGTDRYGIPYPVHFVSWGSGQNALYAYLLIPFVALKDISPLAVRLPMVLAGIFSLPLIFLAGKRLFDERFALLVMFFMAISPWHIVNSRWAVESNILPFLFLAGFTALLFAEKKNAWFLVACAFFAATLYAYGTAYLAAPLFLLLSVPLLYKLGRVTKRQLIFGAALFLLLAFPIGLFIAVNTFHLETIRLGALTVPRLPVEARYETMAAVFGGSPFLAIFDNARIMLDLLWTQSDAYAWNFVKPFGYFYGVTFPLVALGFLLALPFKVVKERRAERWLIAAWMFAAFAVGLIHPVNLTRLNLFFTPALFCLALLFWDLEARLPRSMIFVAGVFFVAFVFFNRAYHSADYRKIAETVFNDGMIPAINYAVKESEPDAPICLTDLQYSLYIYVLATQKYNPTDYVDDLQWIDPEDPADPARTLVALDRFRFTPSACADDANATYILTLKETPPNADINYKPRAFVKFVVFTP